MAAEKKAGAARRAATGGALKTRVEVVNKRGLHGRAAARVVTVAKWFSAEIRFTFKKEIDGRKVTETADGKEIMKLMMLGAPAGSVLEISVSGEDAEEALAALEALFAAGFFLGRE